MSFPGKENLIFFEDLERQQRRIYKDACDVGIQLCPTGDLKKAARENLLTLMGMYAYKIERPEHARCPYDDDFKRVTTTSLFIPFEFDDGAYVGVTLKVHFEPIGKREYLTIDIIRDRKTHAEIEGKLYK